VSRQPDGWCKQAKNQVIMSKRETRKYWVTAIIWTGDHVIQQAHTFAKKAHAVLVISRVLNLQGAVMIESNVPNYKNCSNI
jgi:hypothetical protein